MTYLLKNIGFILILTVLLTSCMLKEPQTASEAIKMGYDMYPECYPQGAQMGIKYFNKALKIEPDNAYAYAGIANAQICLYNFSNKKQDLDKSEENLLHAIKLLPEDPYILNAMADLQIYKEDYNACIDYATKAIENNKLYEMPYELRWQCYKELKQEQKAQQDLKKFKELNKQYHQLPPVKHY